MNELALFAGAGGGILGGLLLGHVPVCAVELEEYPRKVLLQRQRDGILPWFPIWDDIQTFDGKPWHGRIDIISGGFPCQDISPAGKGEGIDGERSGLWREMARVICEVGPRYVFVENSPMLVNRGLGRVLGDLAALGYDAEWCVLGADDVGAPHIRKRIWILAYTSCAGLPPPELETLFRTRWWKEGRTTPQCSRGNVESWICGMADGLANRVDGPWTNEPSGVSRVAKGIKNRVGRLKALGNGQVPQVAALAWRTLIARI